MGWTCFYDNAGLSIDDMMRREWNAAGDNGAVFTIVDSATRGSEWYVKIAGTNGSLYRASAKQLNKATIVEA